MISAYTNYIQKFDYHQVLDNDFIPYSEKRSHLLNFMEQIGLEEGRGKSAAACYSRYAKCLTVDHCQNRGAKY